MASEKTFHMTPEEFRRHGHTVVDWITDFSARIESFPGAFAGRAWSRFGRHFLRPPVAGRAFPAILADIERLILPGIRHGNRQTLRLLSFERFPTSNPPATCSLPAWACRECYGAPQPACTELETHVLDWLGADARFAAEVSFPRIGGGGVIQDTA